MSCVNINFIRKFISTFVFFYTALIFAQPQQVKPNYCDQDQFLRALILADKVHREAWRILTQVNLAEGKSIWGRLGRSYQVINNKVKIKNSIYTCDRYQFKQTKSETKVLLNCGPRHQQKLLAQIECHEDLWHVVFNTSEFSEILGIATSILAPKIDCQLQINNSKLNSFVCKNYHQDMAGQKMVMLDRYSYQKENPIQLEFVGYYLENLRKTKKIQMKVPFEGQIDVVETLVVKPQESNSKSSEPIIDPANSSAKQRGKNEKDSKKINQENNQEQAVEPTRKARQKEIEKEFQQSESLENSGPVDEDGVPEIIPENQVEGNREAIQQEGSEQTEPATSEGANSDGVKQNQ